MTGADTVLAIAAVSLVLSGASLSWQVYNALRVDRARLEVELSERSLVEAPGQVEKVFLVSVTNAGKRATYLTGLWLMFGRPRPWYQRVLPKRLRPSFQFAFVMPGGKLHHYSTPLPTRLEEGGTAATFYERELILQRLKEKGCDTLYGYAVASTVSASTPATTVKGISEAPDFDAVPETGS